MNIFDGGTGRSDGTADGVSTEITGDGKLVNIFVSGEFADAKVTIQKFVETSQAFADTAAIFTKQDIFQGLIVRPGDRFRLNIENSTSTTALVAEVA